MAILIVSFVFSLMLYLALTFGSGNLLFWSREEIIIGLLISLITSVSVKKILASLGIELNYSLLNPKRWIYFIAYALGPFLFQMTKANFDVAYRVITGKIKPGIVKIPGGLKTDIGLTMLANSITLTPGTLSVDVDSNKNLYVHWIHVDNKNPTAEEVCGSFPKWIGRIFE